ncbi:hypothetical protein [Streptomyces sp. NPDC048392]|uniref:hypothetical protein n=1 Tax=Streptomyces sp. NPDC048392 TaxID=3365543 RepID=UPI00371D1429
MRTRTPADPPRAVPGALFAAAVAHGTGHQVLFAEARRRFPDLDRDTSPWA